MPAGEAALVPRLHDMLQRLRVPLELALGCPLLKQLQQREHTGRLNGCALPYDAPGRGATAGRRGASARDQAGMEPNRRGVWAGRGRGGDPTSETAAFVIF
jgi:hypothetical protein